MQFFCLSLRCFIQFHPLVVPRRKWRNNFSSIWAGTIPTQKLWLKKQSCSEEWKYLAPGSGYHILSLALRGAFIVQVIFGNESPILSQHLISAFASMKFYLFENIFLAKASQKHDPIWLFPEAHRFRFLWCSLEEETAIQARRIHARSGGAKGSDCGGE